MCRDMSREVENSRKIAIEIEIYVMHEIFEAMIYEWIISMDETTLYIREYAGRMRGYHSIIAG